MRTSQRPPRLRASMKLPTAANREPRCNDPVGEGAKRPAYAGPWSLPVTVVAVAVLPFAPLAPLLRFEAQGGDRPRLQALDADLLAGLETIAVAAVLDSLQRLVDLANEFALAVPCAQLQAEFLLLGGAVIGIGEVRRLVLHVRDGAIDLDHQIALPAVEDHAKVLELLLAHVLLAALGDIGLDVARSCEEAAGLRAFDLVRVGGGSGHSGRYVVDVVAGICDRRLRGRDCRLRGGLGCGMSGLAHLCDCFRSRWSDGRRCRGRRCPDRCSRRLVKVHGRYFGAPDILAALLGWRPVSRRGLLDRGFRSRRLLTLRGLWRGLLGRHSSLLKSMRLVKDARLYRRTTVCTVAML